MNVEPSVIPEEEEVSIKPETPLEPEVSTGLEESVGTDDSKDETHLSEPFFGTPGTEEESNSESEALNADVESPMMPEQGEVSVNSKFPAELNNSIEESHLNESFLELLDAKKNRTASRKLRAC